MSPRKTCKRPLTEAAGLLAWALMLVLTATAARADRILTQKRIGHSGDIVGVGAEGLIIQSEDAKRAIPISEIAEVRSDKFPDLEKAEKAWAKGAAGDARSLATAEKLYGGLVSGGGAPQWLRALVSARMFKVYADSGRVPEALDAYLELAKSQPAVAADMKLPQPSEEAHAANQAMLKKVDDAMRVAGNRPYASELRSFKTSLMMLEGKPEDVLPMLEPLLASPDEKVRLAAQIRQVELFMAAGKVAEASKCLDGAGAPLAAAYPAEAAFFRGRVLKEGGKNLEAAVEFMMLPVLYPDKDKNRTAEALWLAGQAMEAGKAPPDQIRKVYSEAATKYAGTAGAEKAKRELVRLGAS